MSPSQHAGSIALFSQHPRLASALAHLSLGELPTPVQRLPGVEALTGARGLYVKRDDLSGRPYGGNKLRKLEFLLAAARAQGAAEVLTFGGAGSNHALATAIYARQVGLGSISMLVRQINSGAVRRNLLASWHAGAELHHYPDERGMRAAVRYQLMRHEALTGKTPYVIAGGGSAPAGVVGFVNAALELAAQIRAGELPEPSRIYVALGTAGTVAGLALGLSAAGLGHVRVIAVRVVHPDIGNRARCERLYRDTARLLHEADPAFAPGELAAGAIELRHDFYGERYAQLTPAAVDAIRTLRDADGITLEGTYTGKAFAALLADLRAGPREGCTLFWNTYNSRPLPAAVGRIHYRELPAGFHRYFEQPVQALERELDS